MSQGKDLPKVIEKTASEIEQAVQSIESSDLPDTTKQFVVSCIRLAVWLPNALVEKKISLSNLRKLIFGNGKSRRSKRSKNSPNDKNKNEKEAAANQASQQSAQEENKAAANDESTTPKNQNNKKGHGRMSHEVYTRAIHHTLSILELKPGDLCPSSCGGKLYQKDPGVLVRIKGQNMATVHKYWVEKLRCALCGLVFKADIPFDVGTEKYDAAFKSVLAIQKYYLAVPFYRQAYYQSLLQMPLPASTQWKLIEEVANAALTIFPVLERMAANAKLIHNDDTHLKIIDLIHDNRLNLDKARTGMFTTGIIAKTDEHEIALFYNGTKHAGENMESLLSKRQAESGKAIQMCDALSRNIPASFKTILCHCLSHGVRKFKDLQDFYPEECLFVIKQLAKVYEFDEDTKEMTPEKRLTYHQEHSAPIMKGIKDYLTAQLNQKIVEPNSSLGKAMKYMLKHWHALTQFLRVPGAPLCNNIVERALKIPIRGRRTWLFYKTEYGAMIGGVLTSVIHTCALAGENPLHYLTALQEHKNQIIKEPDKWLPWNYQQQLILQQKAA